MTNLDALLRTLLTHGMDALVLRPGESAHLRLGKDYRAAPGDPLDAAAIERLLRQIAPPGELPPLNVGERVSFDYRLDGQLFTVVVVSTPHGWSAQATVRNTPAPGSPAPARPTTAPRCRVGSLTSLLESMLAHGASDLHLSADQSPRLRIDGDMVELTDLVPPASEEVERLLLEVLPERSSRQFHDTGDTDFAYELAGAARFRVNAFRDQRGAGAVFRRIPCEIPTFEELGLPEELRGLAHLSKGLVLITGATGSGKSTTLAAILDLVNRQRRDHVLTIEDPIEFVHPSRGCLVNQREVGVHTRSFATGLRAALREDPDIILVGEMRDLETTAMALETAETGHLVFATLHTTTAPSTIERLVDQFPSERQSQVRVMLADGLRAVIAQSLLKCVGGGRVAAFEILMATPAVSNLIREGKTFQIASAMQTGRKLGMRMLNDSLFDLVQQGTVSAEEAYLKAVDKPTLVARLRAGGIAVPLEPAD